MANYIPALVRADPHQFDMVSALQDRQHCARAACPAVITTEGKDDNCNYDGLSVKGSKVEGVMSCKSSDPLLKGASLSFSGSFDETSYRGEAEMNMDLPQKGKLQVKVKTTGKYLGECG